MKRTLITIGVIILGGVLWKYVVGLSLLWYAVIGIAGFFIMKKIINRRNGGY